MGVNRFEDLRVWQRAKRQADRVGGLINRPEFRRDEGFLRHRDKEFMQFLRIAAGSNGEVRSCLHAAHGRKYLSQAEAEELIEESNIIGKMIRRLQASLNP